MKQLNKNKFGSFLLILLMLPVSVALALIPEPDNLVYGTVTLDGRVLTALDTDVSIVLQFNGKDISSYTMGDDEDMLDNYVLKVPVDSVLTRNDNMLRAGDSLELFYRTRVSNLSVAKVAVAARGTSIEVNLNLKSADIPVGVDPTAIDTDGDGIADVVEIAAGLNPLDASDATLDSDGDGISNLQEYINGTNITVDDIPPILFAPADKDFSSTGQFTKVDLGVANAYDTKDGKITATPSGDGFYVPGEHIITWTATDAAGNTTTDTQRITVIPLANFNQDQIVAEGSTVKVTVELNGVAPVYPVTIPFTVSGTASGAGVDYNLVDGEIVIASGLTGELSFPILNDAEVNEGIETVIITMGTPVNAVPGSNNIITAHISENNIPAIVKLSANQGGGQTNMIISGSGVVTVTAAVTDNNPADTHTFDWLSTDAKLVDTDGNITDNRFSFDPAGLVDGIYIVTVTVTDSPGAVTSMDLALVVASELPILSAVDTDGDGITDDIEGIGDSDGDGIPDYLDSIKQSNLLPSLSAVSKNYLVETYTGLELGLGNVALHIGNGGAMVTSEAVNTAYIDPSTSNITYSGNIFNYLVSGLSAQGNSVSVVLPQFSAITTRSEFYNFNENDAEWNLFVEDNKNALFSSAGVPGYCPPPGDKSYSAGLTEGHWCVMVIIEDGGPNDMDGTANLVVKGLNGARVKNTSGGGGAFDLLALLLLILVSVFVRRQKPYVSTQTEL